ncbi:hypothetical protein GDO78_004659 [Eleutherodactylus coqui]|uniref:Uncharacterized protein n=1 Tax=Eleutherodactylus coqui TaxID=57060 RepID=A0A8J6ET11_ELECQ|nr:hypothetical protein GDO78_004659 [Eleutherodactylus coqui]
MVTVVIKAVLVLLLFSACGGVSLFICLFLTQHKLMNTNGIGFTVLPFGLDTRSPAPLTATFAALLLQYWESQGVQLNQCVRTRARGIIVWYVHMGGKCCRKRLKSSVEKRPPNHGAFLVDVAKIKMLLKTVLTDVAADLR